MDEKLINMEVDFFKALAHPTRILILRYLGKEEKCVCEIIQEVAVEQSSVSQHLAVLRNQGIVSFRKGGMRAIYKVNYPKVFDLLDLVEQILVSRVDQFYTLLNKR